MSQAEVQRTARRGPARKSGTTARSGSRMIEPLTVPAIVMNLRWDVLAWNRVNSLIYRDYGPRAPTDRNLLEILLTRPVHHMSREQLEIAAQRMVARLRFDYSRCACAVPANAAAGRALVLANEAVAKAQK